MNRALAAVVVVPPVLLSMPLHTGPYLTQVWVCLGISEVIGALVLLTSQVPLRWIWGIAPMAVAVWAAALGWVALTKDLGFLGFPMNWQLPVLCGVLVARAGAWPVAQRLFLAAGVVATCYVSSAFLEGVQIALSTLPLNALILAIAIWVGAQQRHHRLRQAWIQERVRRTERETMARELHDVLAHEVSGVVLLAQGLGKQTDRSELREGFALIEQSGQRSLEHIRSLVATWGRVPADTHQPQSLSDVAELVAGFRASSAAEVSLELPEEELPPHLGSTVWRVVAESLTNIRRHAGSATEIAVRIADSPTAETPGYTVTVTDNGRGGGLGSGGGSGLVSLAERVDLLGGRLDSVTLPSGGWRTRVWLPRSAPSGESLGSTS